MSSFVWSTFPSKVLKLLGLDSFNWKTLWIKNPLEGMEQVDQMDGKNTQKSARKVPQTQSWFAGHVSSTHWKCVDLGDRKKVWLRMVWLYRGTMLRMYMYPLNVYVCSCIKQFLHVPWLLSIFPYRPFYIKLHLHHLHLNNWLKSYSTGSHHNLAKKVASLKKGKWWNGYQNTARFTHKVLKGESLSREFVVRTKL